MKKILLASAILAAAATTVSLSVFAQTPAEERPEGGPPRHEGGPGENGPPRPPHPIMDALDKNGDREISEDEIANAVVALKTLDKNGDGKLTDDEMRPPRQEGGPDGPPRGEYPRGEDGPRGEFRPPRDGEGRPPRDGDFPPARDGEGRPPRDGDFRQPRDREGRLPQGRGEGPPGRPMGPSNPERFVEDALRFDADKDGKLDKAELLKFATEMGNRQGRPPGPDGGRGQGRPPGDRSPGDRPLLDGPPEERGDRPEGDRPQRPPVEE